MHFKKLISFCITSVNNEIFSILSIYKKTAKWSEIASTLMPGRLGLARSLLRTSSTSYQGLTSCSIGTNHFSQKQFGWFGWSSQQNTFPTDFGWNAIGTGFSDFQISLTTIAKVVNILAKGRMVSAALLQQVAYKNASVLVWWKIRWWMGICSIIVVGN